MELDGHGLLWGDLHNHNSVGLYNYSKGSLARTLEIGRSHLHFMAFTGHARWHDMPEMPKEGHLKWQEGFEYHSEQWPETQRQVEAANEPGEFTVFLGYEWHSAENGDRSVILPGGVTDLVLPDSIQALTGFAMETGALLVPHHIGYKSGLPGRGANWDSIDERVSPVVEIYSEHGGAERDRGPWPYIRHTNGPRTTYNTLQHGWSLGKRVGVTAGTDDHFGCPGAYGEGLTGVYAAANNRDAILDAIRARRVYGVTGDRIELAFRLNGAPMGSILPSCRKRHFEIEAHGWDDVAMVELLKNNRVIHRHFPEDAAIGRDPFESTVLCRVEYGWGPWAALGIPRTAGWDVRASVEDGRFLRYVPCFQSGPFDEERRNAVDSFEPDECTWHSFTSREGAWDETPTNALVFEIEASPETRLTLEFGAPEERSFTYSFGGLAKTSAIEFMDRFPCESFLVHRLVPRAMASAAFTFEDSDESPADFYYVRVTQANGQMAWSSPIWVGDE